jgi:hypothetical protein
MAMNFRVPINMYFFIICQQENLKESQDLEDLGMDARISWLHFLVISSTVKLFISDETP